VFVENTRRIGIVMVSVNASSVLEASVLNIAQINALIQISRNQNSQHPKT